jgi:hypothetical protein
MGFAVADHLAEFTLTEAWQRDNCRYQAIDGMRRSIPDHGCVKLPVISALKGAITNNKEIDA